MHRLKKPVWMFAAEGGGEGGDGGAEGGSGGDTEGQEGNEQTFTQADVDAAVQKVAAKIRAEERQKVSEKFADYDDLKKAAEGKKSADDRIADLESRYAAAEARALRADIANEHGISAEDRDLFLTGTDEETLTAQAKRLAARESERKKQGNRVPREGNTNRSNEAGDEDRRAFVRQLTGRD